MELAPIPDDVVQRAAHGDAAAAEDLLLQLASKSPQEQLSALRVLQRADEPGFWRHLLAYLATNLWAGRPLPRNGAGLWQALRPRIHSLFLSASLAEGAKRARREALLDSLADGDAETRVLAMEIVAGGADGDGVPAIVAALHDERRYVRLTAAHALESLRDASTVPALVEALSAEDGVLAGLAKDALVAIGSPASGALAAVLQNRKTGNQARWLAARALEQIADRSTIPALVAALDDPDYGIRWASAHGLAALKIAGLRATLEALISGTLDAWVADAAAQVVHRAQPREVANIVQPVLAALQSVDYAWRVPVAAKRALDELDAKGF